VEIWGSFTEMCGSFAEIWSLFAKTWGSAVYRLVRQLVWLGTASSAETCGSLHTFRADLRRYGALLRRHGALLCMIRSKAQGRVCGVYERVYVCVLERERVCVCVRACV